MQHVELRNRRLVAENSKWKVFFDHIVDGHGNEVQDFLVVAAQVEAVERVTGVAILPIINDRIVLIRCYRHALRSQAWEVPHGFVDNHETHAEAALRELNEETGLTCAPEDLRPLGFYAPEASTIAARGALFAAERSYGDLKVPSDELGLMDVREFTSNEVEYLVANGEIEDAATLITYFRYNGLKNRTI